MKSEFAEKHYESFFNEELYAIPSDQVAEKVLGYDATALPPTNDPIWSYLGCPPSFSRSGTVLYPQHWTNSPGGNPTTKQLAMTNIQSTSLVLQYKRSEYLKTKNSKQYHLWNNFYYRFAVDNNQQTVLDILENNLSKFALVRYAAPSFHTIQEITLHRQNREIAKKSGYVSPSKLTGHHYWTFTAPGSYGKANVFRGEHETFEELETLVNKLQRLSTDDPKNTIIKTANGFMDTLNELNLYYTERDRSKSEQIKFLLDFLQVDGIPLISGVENEEILKSLRVIEYSKIFLNVDWKLCLF